MELAADGEGPLSGSRPTPTKAMAMNPTADATATAMTQPVTICHLRMWTLCGMQGLTA